jgi:hypothetical protein
MQLKISAWPSKSTGNCTKNCYLLCTLIKNLAVTHTYIGTKYCTKKAKNTIYCTRKTLDIRPGEEYAPGLR